MNMKKLTHVFAAFALVVTVAFADVTLVKAEEPIATDPVIVFTEPTTDPAVSGDPATTDPADPSDPATTDPTDPSEPVEPNEPSNEPVVEEQAASAHLSSGSVWGRDERTDVIDLSGEIGDIIEEYFKINFDNSTLIGSAFYDGDNLSSYCTNLPEGISLIKYTNTGGIIGSTGADYMRVFFSGTLKEATHSANVSITIPKEKLIAYDGYYIPEEGITVSLVVTVNGEPVVITVPVEPVKYTEQEVDNSTEWERWIDSIVEQIKKAPENGTVEITTKIYTGYTKRVIDALSTRQDVTLVTNYVNEDGETTTVTIPAGTFSSDIDVTAENSTYNAGVTITDEPTALTPSIEQATTSVNTIQEFVKDKVENNNNFFNFNAFGPILK